MTPLTRSGGEVRQADLAHEREVLGEHDGPFDDFDLVPINLGGVVGGCDHVPQAAQVLESMVTTSTRRGRD